MKVLGLVLLSVTALLAAPSDVLKSFISANNLFTADVYKEFRSDADVNFVVCPLSLDVLLGLIHAGASGTTAQQISKALHLPETREAIDAIYLELHPNLQANQEYTLRSANRIYVKNECPINKEYHSKAAHIFGADVINLDFTQKEASASEINRWVSDRTEGKISELVSRDDITSDLRIVLLNAIYFKGKWTKQFKKDLTSKKPFYVTKKSYVEVDMMEQSSHFNYYYNKELKAKYVELPYQGNNITMTLVLPDKVEGLAALEERIHEVVVEPHYFSRRVNLQMPKNKIETKIQFKPILEKLGVSDVFSTSADLKHMTESQEQLYISTIVQKAIIETDEEGTVAAAVTGGFVMTASLPPPPVNFNANHPHIFFLKHKEVGILFIGRYSRPSGTEVILEHPIKEEVEPEYSW